jgi:hypothetical protein
VLPYAVIFSSQRFSFNIEKQVLRARSEFNGFAGKKSLGVLE